MENLGDKIDTALKKEAIDIFIEVINKNNVFGKFMSVSEISKKLDDTIRYVEYGDAGVGIAGYWHSVDKHVRISGQYNNIRRDALSVVVHELIHALTDGPNRQCGIKDSYGHFVGINEGATEWLNTKILPDYATKHTFKYELKNISFEQKGTYGFEQIGIKQLIALYGEDVVIEAMLKNDIKKIIDKVPDSYAFKEYAMLFDHINELNSRIRTIMNGKTKIELSEEENRQIDYFEKKICNDFSQAQEIFLSRFLLVEMNEAIISHDINKLEELKEKMKQINNLKVNIEGAKEVNYEKYNILFIKAYLKIVNQGKEPDKKIKFDEVEQYILGKTQLQWNQHENADTGRTNTIFSKVKEMINRGRDYIKSRTENIIFNKNDFTPILTDEGIIVYVKKCGEQIIADKKVSEFEYLTEEQYREYSNGNKEIRGSILKGIINFKDLRKDKKYRELVGKRLLTKDKIDDSRLNCGGYIGAARKTKDGGIDFYSSVDVVDRFKEDIEAVPVGTGENTKYLVEVKNIKSNKIGIGFYRYIAKDQLDKYRMDLKNTSIAYKMFDSDRIIIDRLDMKRLRNDKKYNEFLANEFLTDERLEKYKQMCHGYLGGIQEISTGNFREICDPVFREQLSDKGINGEKKVQFFPGRTLYIKDLGVEYVDGNEQNIYEIISSKQMIDMHAGKYSDRSGDRVIIRGDIEEVLTDKYLGYDRLCNIISIYGGHIEKNPTKCSKDYIFVHGPKQYRIWKQENTYHVSEFDDELGVGDIINNSTIINGNLDAERMENDPEYDKFVRDHVLTQENLGAICEGHLKGFNIIENENGFELVCEEKIRHEKKAREVSMQDR